MDRFARRSASRAATAGRTFLWRTEIRKAQPLRRARALDESLTGLPCASSRLPLRSALEDRPEEPSVAVEVVKLRLLQARVERAAGSPVFSRNWRSDQSRAARCLPIALLDLDGSASFSFRPSFGYILSPSVRCPTKSGPDTCEHVRAGACGRSARLCGIAVGITVEIGWPGSSFGIISSVVWLRPRLPALANWPEWTGERSFA